MNLLSLLERVPQMTNVHGIYPDLNALIQNPEVSNFQIVRLFERDPVVTRQILQIVNSCHFDFPTATDSLSDAVAIIGISQLRDLVLAQGIIGMSRSVLQKDQERFFRYWRHPLACGLAARVVAMLRREYNLESFFLAGLLHDVGRLLLIAAYPDELYACQQQAQAQGLPLYSLERQQFGVDAGELGAALMQHWRLPQHLQIVARYHHEPEHAPEYQSLVALIHYADNLTYQIAAGEPDSPEPLAIAADFVQQWGVAPDLHKVILQQTELLLQDAYATFLCVV